MIKINDSLPVKGIYIKIHGTLIGIHPLNDTKIPTRNTNK
jgi:hypothetical protein